MAFGKARSWHLNLGAIIWMINDLYKLPILYKGHVSSSLIVDNFGGMLNAVTFL